MTDKLQAIRERCIAANPAILCPDCGGLGYTVIPTEPDGEAEQVQCNCYERPIRLADVLWAMKESGKCNDGYYSMGTDGAFYKVQYTYPDGNHCVVTHEGMGIYASWELKNDDLSLQSKETIEFLYELLK